MIPYKVVQHKSLKDQTVSYCAAVATVQPLTLDDVTRQIEKASTVSSADIKAVLDMLQYVVVGAVQAGNSVRLGDLGSFRPTITSSSQPTPEAVSVADIRGVRCHFTVSGAMRRALRKENVGFRFAGLPVQAEAAALAEEAALDAEEANEAEPEASKA